MAWVVKPVGKKSLALAVAGGLALGLAGCLSLGEKAATTHAAPPAQMGADAGAGQAMEPQASSQALPEALPPSSPPSPPNVILYRRTAFFLDNKPLFVSIDGEEKYRLDILQTTEFYLAPGSHVVRLRCAGTDAPIVREWRTADYPLTIEETGTTWVELGPCTFTEREREIAERESAGFEKVAEQKKVTIDFSRMVPSVFRKEDAEAKDED